jgi:similar to stage IV sporulation protein
MKNNIIYKLKSKIKLIITGKNINRFIIRLNNNDIEILKSNQINKEQIEIIIYEKDLEKIQKLKTIYNIEKKEEYGLIKIKKEINKNKYIIISMILGYALLIFLCNIIYEVDIIHNDEEIRTFLKQELKQYGIKEKTFKKNYKQIDKIKKEIIDKNRDKIEWLEIENIGTKYIVRVETRIIKEKEKEPVNRNIIAKKDAVIKKIEAEQGQIIKEINNYVKKGDVVISGNIYAEENIKNIVPAKGKVYGETWYEISVSYPFIYNETKLTNNKKKVLSIKVLDKTIELTKNKYKNKKIVEKTIIKNNLLPLSIVIQNQTEQNIIEQILTKEQTLEKAEQLGIEKMKNNLKENEYIIEHKILNTNIKENELELNMFFSVYEDITDYETITQEENIE